MAKRAQLPSSVDFKHKRSTTFTVKTSTKKMTWLDYIYIYIYMYVLYVCCRPLPLDLTMIFIATVFRSASRYIFLSMAHYGISKTRSIFVDPALASCAPWTHTTLSFDFPRPRRLHESNAERRTWSVPIIDPTTVERQFRM